MVQKLKVKIHHQEKHSDKLFNWLNIRDKLRARGNMYYSRCLFTLARSIFRIANEIEKEIENEIIRQAREIRPINF